MVHIIHLGKEDQEGVDEDPSSRIVRVDETEQHDQVSYAVEDLDYDGNDFLVQDAENEEGQLQETCDAENGGLTDSRLVQTICGKVLVDDRERPKGYADGDQLEEPFHPDCEHIS